MRQLEYRKAQANDAKQLAALRIVQLREEGNPLPDGKEDSLEDWYQRHLHDGSFLSWLALEGEVVVAASGMSFADKPPYTANPTGRLGLLSNMYTAPAYRRKGIAKKLLGYVTLAARERGCGVIQVTASETGMLLYHDFGFEPCENCMQYKV